MFGERKGSVGRFVVFSQHLLNRAQFSLVAVPLKCYCAIKDGCQSNKKTLPSRMSVVIMVGFLQGLNTIPRITILLDCGKCQNDSNNHISTANKPMQGRIGLCVECRGCPFLLSPVIVI